VEGMNIDRHRGSLMKKHASILYLEGRNDDALSELKNAKSHSGDTGIAILEAEILAQTGKDMGRLRLIRQLSRASRV
jgi:hypothetical protein